MSKHDNSDEVRAVDAADEDSMDHSEDVISEDSFSVVPALDGSENEEETYSIGDVKLSESGLSLPIDVNEESGHGDVISREVTRADLAALADVETELASRNSEIEIDPSLERMELLMDLLGHPERAFPSIHIAGTNGKTSTVYMIDSLLRAFARRTGRTTSPYLQAVTEIISIDGQPIHPADYVRIYEEIKPYIEMADTMSLDKGGERLSAFEVRTAMAIGAFADAPVDVAVVETGMGGEWDATNVISSDVAVITPIDMDHQQYLGETIEEIAGQKAGIIKSRWDADDLLTPPDNVVIVSEQDPAALKVILEQAIKVDAAVARAGAEFGVEEASIAVGGQQITLRGLGGIYSDIFLPLSGEHQARNAAVALAAVEAFFGAGAGRQLDVDTVRRGFGMVTVPGRLERVRNAPTVFIDAAHNPHGAKALAGALERDFDFSRLIGVLACFKDKDVQGILRALEPVLSEVVITENSSPRTMPADELAEEARFIFGEERVHVAYNLPGAVELAVELAEDTDLQSGAGVVITGSVVTAGEARTLFGKEPA